MAVVIGLATCSCGEAVPPPAPDHGARSDAGTVTHDVAIQDGATDAGATPDGSDMTTHRDAGADLAVTTDPRVMCCPSSDPFMDGGCNKLGGAVDAQGGCADECDGRAADFTRGTDASGCPVWIYTGP
jgi:hypothetical protein